MNPIPVKFYVITAAIVALIIGLAVFAWHEREAGALAISTADARVAAAREVHNAEVESRAKSLSDDAVARFQADQLQPVVVPAPLTRLVCVAPAPRAKPVPDHAGPAASGDGSAAVPAESDVPFDPAPALLKDGRDADDQVTLLQSYIRDCQAQGLCRKK